MAVISNIEIDGREVPFKASATIPRIYRVKFRRDIFADLRMLYDDVKAGSEAQSTLTLKSLEVFENIAYTMAKYADPSVPDTPEEWLDQFTTFSIYRILPEIFKLWGMNMETEAEAKKNLDRLTAR